jgi:Prokaryotic membrane lipoprotein lipid attachment site
LKKYILFFAILLIILSGCNRNAAEMITDGRVIIDKEDSTVTFKGVLTDQNLDADTSFQARFFLQGSTIRNALGKDLIYTEKELKSDSDLKKAEEYEVETTIEVKQPDKIDELIKAIRDKDEEVVTIEVINDNGRLDDKVIHKVEEK